MADPGDGDLALAQFRKHGPAMLPGAAGKQRFPNHFVEESARVEMFGGREVFERFGQRLFFWSGRSWHVDPRKIVFRPTIVTRVALHGIWGGAAAPPTLYKLLIHTH